MADDSPAVTGVVILTALGASVSFFDGDGSGDPEDAGHDPVFVGFEGGSTTAAKVMAAATGARPAKSASEGGADDAGSDAVLADLAGRLLDAICASLSGSGALDAGVQLSAREPPLVAALNATAQTTAGHAIEVVEPSALPSFPKMHRMARAASVDSAGERLHQSQRGLSFLAGGEATHSTSASTGDAMISQAVALAGELERDIKTNVCGLVVVVGCCVLRGVLLCAARCVLLCVVVGYCCCCAVVALLLRCCCAVVALSCVVMCCCVLLCVVVLLCGA